MMFCALNPKKIWHQQLAYFPTSPVYCSHFTLKNPKNSFFQQYYLYILQIIYVIWEENKLLLPYHHTWKCHRTTVYNAQFFHFFFIFPRVLITNPRYGRVAEALQHRLNFSTAWWTMQLISGENTGSMYLCRRWSPWTFAVTLLAWHSIRHISQPLLFRATNANPQPAFFQSHQRLEECYILSVRWKSCAFCKVVWWHFSGVVGKEITVCFLLR